MELNKKSIRKKFKTDVFKRDKYKCLICGSTEYLTVHHITDRNEMPNGGYVVENGITVCPDCHFDVELFHITEGIEYTPNLHPNDLYRMINSSKELALEKSKQ